MNQFTSSGAHGRTTTYPTPEDLRLELADKLRAIGHDLHYMANDIEAAFDRLTSGKPAEVLVAIDLVRLASTACERACHAAEKSECRFCKGHRYVQSGIAHIPCHQCNGGFVWRCKP